MSNGNRSRWREIRFFLVVIFIVVPLVILGGLVVLYDPEVTFGNALEDGGYPNSATIRDTRVVSSGEVVDAYNAYIEVGKECSLKLQMREPGLIGGGDYILVSINDAPARLDNSPTFDEVLTKGQSLGFRQCRK